MPRYALKIAYWGEPFEGFATQPGRLTVEGTILDGLRRRGLAGDPPGRHLPVASRTDRGVHALGNVVVWESSLPGEVLARVFNALDPRIACVAWAEVGRDFHPRRASQRWYRYLETARDRDPARWARWARLFVGEHDFVHFSRHDPGHRTTRGRIQAFEVTRQGEFLVLDVRAPFFLWNQVRKMVGALHQMQEGRWDEEDLRQALQGTRRLDPPVAPAGSLILMDVLYDLAWTPVRRGVRAQRRFFDAELEVSRLRTTLLGWMRDRMFPGSSSEEDSSAVP